MEATRLLVMISSGRRFSLVAALTLATSSAAAQPAGHFEHAEITESSGATASRKQSGIFWTINDSGGFAKVYAFDLRGRDKGAWHLSGAGNRDWEAIALGPCPRGDCLYIGDIGDNDAKRKSVTIYRIVEPDAGAPGEFESPPVERLEVQYPDGARDAEAMYVSRDGTLWIISKGRERSSSLYRIRKAAWAKGRATGERVSTTPLTIEGPSSFITDAALAPASDRIAVRTYTDLYILAAKGDGAIGKLLAHCDLQQLGEPQGEGITWTADDLHLVATSEGGAGIISRTTCPPP